MHLARRCPTVERIFGRLEPFAFALFRMVFGFLFLQFGTQKLFGWPFWPIVSKGVPAVLFCFALLLIATRLDLSWTSIAERRTQRKTSRASFIEARDGTPLFYRDWGSGNPVVFLHSWAVHSDIWQYQMVHLASKGFRCVTYDRRGHGRSGDPGRGYDFDTLADDLNAVVEQLELRKIILVGHSMGCGEIIRYLTRRGSERATRVLLVAPTLPFLLKTDDNPEGIDGRVFESLRSSWKKDFPAWLVENTRQIGRAHV